MRRNVTLTVFHKSCWELQLNPCSLYTSNQWSCLLILSPKECEVARDDPRNWVKSMRSHTNWWSRSVSQWEEWAIPRKMRPGCGRSSVGKWKNWYKMRTEAIYLWPSPPRVLTPEDARLTDQISDQRGQSETRDAIKQINQICNAASAGQYFALKNTVLETVTLWMCVEVQTESIGQTSYNITIQNKMRSIEQII